MSDEEVDTGLIEATPGSIVASTFESPPKQKTNWILGAVVVLSLVATFGVGIAHISSLQNRVDSQHERITALNGTVQSLIEENTALVDNSQILFDQIVQLGETPQGTKPASVEGPQGLPGLRGLPGTPGLNGLDGEDGVPGTPGQNGKDGKDGENGTPGVDGAPGTPGAPGAKGDQGDPGIPGAPGQDGRGISSIACTNVGELTITYTDGTTQSFAIPCTP